MILKKLAKVYTQENLCQVGLNKKYQFLKKIMAKKVSIVILVSNMLQKKNQLHLIIQLQN